MASHAVTTSSVPEPAKESLRLRSRTVSAALADGMAVEETCVMVTHLGIVMKRAADWAKLMPRVHAHYGTWLLVCVCWRFCFRSSVSDALPLPAPTSQ